jgi:NAD(P)-dependent dehydrogenase (short-subunit alcohol dehydrogenase family)
MYTQHATLGGVEAREGHFDGVVAYAQQKRAQVLCMERFAERLQSSGVTANAVCPGSTATGMLDASAAIYGMENRDAFAEQARIGRLIDPDEIAATIEWLCVDAPAALTGSLIDVDGGFRA